MRQICQQCCSTRAYLIGNSSIVLSLPLSPPILLELILPSLFPSTIALPFSFYCLHHYLCLILLLLAGYSCNCTRVYFPTTETRISGQSAGPFTCGCQCVRSLSETIMACITPIAWPGVSWRRCRVARKCFHTEAHCELLLLAEIV